VAKECKILDCCGFYIKYCLLFNELLIDLPNISASGNPMNGDINRMVFGIKFSKSSVAAAIELKTFA
jgi:hypothetical protein